MRSVYSLQCNDSYGCKFKCMPKHNYNHFSRLSVHMPMPFVIGCLVCFNLSYMAFFLDVFLLKSSCLSSLGDKCFLLLISFSISVIVPRFHISSFYQTFVCYSNLFSNSVNSSSKGNIWLESFGVFYTYYFSCSHILSHFVLWHYMFYCRRAMAFCLNSFTLLEVFSNFIWITGK